MSCCGQRRTAWRQPERTAAAAPAPQPPDLSNPTRVAFTGAEPIVVRGASTGLTYAFPAQSRGLDVDARDAVELLATGRFTPA